MNERSIKHNQKQSQTRISSGFMLTQLAPGHFTCSVALQLDLRATIPSFAHRAPKPSPHPHFCGVSLFFWEARNPWLPPHPSLCFSSRQIQFPPFASVTTSMKTASCSHMLQWEQRLGLSETLRVKTARSEGLRKLIKRTWSWTWYSQALEGHTCDMIVLSYILTSKATNGNRLNCEGIF